MMRSGLDAVGKVVPVVARAGARVGCCVSDGDHQLENRRGMATAKKAKKGRSGKTLGQKTQHLLKLLDAKPTPMPELSAEEKQRNFEIGRRYNSKMGAEHNARMADFTMKIKLRDDAIAHLPEMLQHAARQKDRNPPPLNRRMASYTPPIPNFNPDDYGPKEDERDAEVDRFS